jgi:DNA-nicking Smr family endonuclease
MAKQSKTSSAGAADGDDETLWKRVAQSAEPLKRGKNRATLRDKPPSNTRAPKPKTPKTKKQPAPASAPAAKPAPPPPPGSYDRKEARNLGKGRTEIDARIDLHGMRQREAHGALLGFLTRAREKGHRHVLVITGKGTPRGAEADDSFFSAQSGKRGVLRDAVPRWLGEPAFRAMVVGFTPAAPRHGGEGALYVRLRRAREQI